jgi:hypothetical protein
MDLPCPDRAAFFHQTFPFLTEGDPVFPCPNGAEYSRETDSFLTKGDDDTQEDKSQDPAVPRPVVTALFRWTVPFLTKGDDDAQEDKSQEDPALLRPVVLKQHFFVRLSLFLPKETMTPRKTSPRTQPSLVLLEQHILTTFFL